MTLIAQSLDREHTRQMKLNTHLPSVCQLITQSLSYIALESLAVEDAKILINNKPMLVCLCTGPMRALFRVKHLIYVYSNPSVGLVYIAYNL